MVMPRIVALLILSAALPLIAQEDDAALRSLMTKRSIFCYDIRVKCFDLIPAYVAAGKRDSAIMLQNAWVDECEGDPLALRTGLLLALEDDQFTEELYGEEIIADMLSFAREVHAPPPGSERGYEIERAEQTYATFTRLLARDLAPRTEPGTPEYLLARHYSGGTDSSFAELQGADYEGTMLRRYYDETVRSTLSEYVDYFGLSVGLWEPVGKAIRPMGRHPEIGAFVGRGNNVWDMNIHFFLHLGDAREPYTYTYLGSELTSQAFLGGGLGFEIARKVVFQPKKEFSLIVGGAIASYVPPQPDADEKKGVNSIHLTLGTSYGFRPQAYGGTEMHIQFRYNQFLFGTEGITGPTGSFLSLRFMTSFSLGDHRREQLERLSYRGD
jgi:hypothetical protein